ncbi:MAG: hypothetical protein BWZ10_02557 [candidate division BRC1 bacterium ADurb.BinA364]|nr:MAG: hypothetical protein BWZ10_02557 [candidate division BRC1 bacterium ADurb.BinA364]
MALDQRGKAEGFIAENLGGKAGVANLCGAKIAETAQQPKVIVAAVENDRFAFERFEQGLRIDAGQRIEHEVIGLAGNLRQTELFLVMMKTVGFGVDGHARGIREARNGERQRIRAVNKGELGNRNGLGGFGHPLYRTLPTLHIYA